MIAHIDSVQSLQVSTGIIKANVFIASERNERRCDVTIHVARWDESAWQQALAILASEASYMAAMLNGYLPFALQQTLHEANIDLNVSGVEWQSTCQCEQDHCTHIELTWLAFFKTIHSDPLQLFLLKGTDEQQLLQHIRTMRSMRQDDANEVIPNDEASFRSLERPDDQSQRRTLYFDDPDFWPKQVPLYTVLRPLYKRVSLKAQRILKEVE